MAVELSGRMDNPQNLGQSGKAKKFALRISSKGKDGEWQSAWMNCLVFESSEGFELVNERNAKERITVTDAYPKANVFVTKTGEERKEVEWIVNSMHLGFPGENANPPSEANPVSSDIPF